jgi:SAM-dependent methyltransferase
VDIGCGKGRALFVAEYCGYSNLTGIELDPSLLEIARQNAELFAFRRPESVFNFALQNAVEYNYLDKPTVYFLFNPFNEEILRQVLTAITKSSSSVTWFVYMNPVFRAPFNELEIKKVLEIKTGFYTEAIVYRL